MTSLRTLRVGLLGAGTVGSEVLRLLRERENRLAAIGVRLHLVGVLARDLVRPRRVPEGTPLTNDPAFLEDCDLVIEVMGGVERPLELLLPVLRARRPVVTANKALLAERWDDLRDFAEAGRLYYEASVLAGTPVISAMATSLRGSRVTRLMALLSGTCNFILGRMEAGETYENALAQAQRQGYAEDPPTLDVSGLDSAHKLTVLARLVGDPGFALRDVVVSGIEHLTPDDVAAAAARGERLRLVSELERAGLSWRAHVRAVGVSAEHPLCSPHAARNALWLEAEGCGELFFSGNSGGGRVTASAVIGDVFGVLTGVPGHRPLPRPSATEW